MSSYRFLSSMLLSVAIIFVITSSSPAQTFTSLYSFTGSYDSGRPGNVTLVQGRDGLLYGTNIGHGNSNGMAFSISSAGTESQFYSFGRDGMNPSGLILATNGNFYGTTVGGGVQGDGVLFELSPSRTFKSLHEFMCCADGSLPESSPIQASDGNFYGTTTGTGEASTIYKYTPAGAFSTLYNFSSAQGQFAQAPLIEGTDGNLYGTAEYAGANGCGTIFKFSKSGTLLWDYSFTCGAGGFGPSAPLLQASDGNFYGTTNSGGNAQGCGLVFKLDQFGNVSTLYVFQNGLDGCGATGIMQATDGNFYGTTVDGGTNNVGTLYRLSLTGAHTVLYSFASLTGDIPPWPPMQDTNGQLYGVTYVGGTFNYGTVYNFNLGLAPFATFVQHTGAIGHSAQILAQGLTGTTSVSFNGIPAASFSVVSDTYLTAIVPAGATTGPVVVTTPSGPLTSNVNFRIVH